MFFTFSIRRWPVDYILGSGSDGEGPTSIAVPRAMHLTNGAPDWSKAWRSGILVEGRTGEYLSYSMMYCLLTKKKSEPFCTKYVAEARLCGVGIGTSTRYDTNPFTLRVPQESIVCYFHTFENNLEIK